MPDTHSPSEDEGATNDRAREGLEHLQAAARELIEAARAVLDVAEDLVNDPETVASVVGTVGSLGDLVRHRAGTVARGRATPGDGSADTAGEHGGAVERITVL